MQSFAMKALWTRFRNFLRGPESAERIPTAVPEQSSPAVRVRDEDGAGFGYFSDGGDSQPAKGRRNPRSLMSRHGKKQFVVVSAMQCERDRVELSEERVSRKPSDGKPR